MIVGQYTLDMGFGAMGSIITSDQNFARFLHGYPLENVNLGLLLLAPGATPRWWLPVSVLPCRLTCR